LQRGDGHHIHRRRIERVEHEQRNRRQQQRAEDRPDDAELDCRSLVSPPSINDKERTHS
jgi:hypothetical protein